MCVDMSSHKAHLTRAAAPACADSLTLTDKGADDAFFFSEKALKLTDKELTALKQDMFKQSQARAHSVYLLYYSVYLLY